jgi:hypothetical protein
MKFIITLIFTSILFVSCGKSAQEKLAEQELQRQEEAKKIREAERDAIKNDKAASLKRQQEFLEESTKSISEIGK